MLGNEALDSMLVEIDRLAGRNLDWRTVSPLLAQPVLVGRYHIRALEDLLASQLGRFGNEVLLVYTILIAVGARHRAPGKNTLLYIDEVLNQLFNQVCGLALASFFRVVHRGYL